MASAGLPKSGRIGFELFDKTNFGATEFAEHVNYRRALEGELERSIMSLSEVEQARVHLTFPKIRSSWNRGSRAKPASSCGSARAQALRAERRRAHQPGRQRRRRSCARSRLVARYARQSAQPPQAPLPIPTSRSPPKPAIEYRQKIESDLLAKDQRHARASARRRKFRAGVSVDCDFTSGEQSEETLDPTNP